VRSLIIHLPLDPITSQMSSDAKSMNATVSLLISDLTIRPIVLDRVRRAVAALRGGWALFQRCDRSPATGPLWLSLPLPQDWLLE
jgi:hypothetical protein